MTAKAAGDIAAVLAAYDFSRFSTIADIGGGRGHLLRAALQAAPRSTGILFDLPAVIDTVQTPAERFAVQAGDFFVDPLPTADSCSPAPASTPSTPCPHEAPLRIVEAVAV